MTAPLQDSGTAHLMIEKPHAVTSCFSRVKMRGSDDAMAVATIPGM